MNHDGEGKFEKQMINQRKDKFLTTKKERQIEHAQLLSESTFLIRIYTNKGSKISVLQNAIIEWKGY